MQPDRTSQAAPSAEPVSAAQAPHPPGSGEALQLAGHLAEAEQAYRQALARNPDDARTLSNYGGLLCTLGHFDQAREVLARALALAPDLADAWSNMGNALFRLQIYDDAIIAYQQCLRRNPVHALALSNLGMLLDQRGQHELAQKFHAAAVQLTPRNALTRTNYALSLLAQGDYRRGFEEYEWRWNTLDSRNSLHAPLWNGESFAGRTLLIHTEGGFGDMIQFARFIPLAAARGGRTLTCVRPQLLSLLRQSFPDQVFLSEDDPTPAHDLQCSVLSLPRALGTTLDTIPCPQGYLRTNPRKAAFWAEKLAQDAQASGVASGAGTGAGAAPLRVGLVWAGAPHAEVLVAEQANRQRSTDLATFAPLVGAVPSTLFYSLQVGEKSDQARIPPPGMRLFDHTALLHDFSDTAALVSQLDLVVTVDTATAHVAAGLGKPTWMLSRLEQCWRWLSGRIDSPWYDSLRIYRQVEPRDWSDPMARMTADLRQFARTHARNEQGSPA
ncbi:tetratricopeptide repeat-containing glycosyltransferase family protein [Acetobacter sp. TBRC 12305]|uniref:Glycosyltransferase family protein n=1 Tax=Acetobacter garciniae TaxID=2817435 RepID=A0A939KNA4_9PROT|nr:tetratricopeptide repeat-containing glycosyltransferase family protein [Acetobacter garciniae]MBO1326153.1 glycosyltransferase family protein [Acetobacter garciniae]MBX0345103.1 tetratricopeptide repeat-containing glycosyltransferase family protein [Acetobacter garciniae]